MRCILLWALLVAGSDGVHEDVFDLALGVDDLIEGLTDGPMKRKIKSIAGEAQRVFNSVADGKETMDETDLNTAKDSTSIKKEDVSFRRFVKNKLSESIPFKAMDKDCDGQIDENEYAEFVVRVLVKPAELPIEWPKETSCEDEGEEPETVETAQTPIQEDLVAGSHGVHEDVFDLDELIKGLTDGPMKSKIKSIAGEAQRVFKSVADGKETMDETALNTAKDSTSIKKEDVSFRRFVKNKLSESIPFNAMDNNCDEQVDEGEYAVFAVRVLVEPAELPIEWPKATSCESEAVETVQTQIEEDPVKIEEDAAVAEANAEAAVKSGGVSEPTQDTADDGLCDGVDVNTASKNELAKVKGIGKATAREIVNHRPYDNVEHFQTEFSKVTWTRKEFTTSGANVWEENLKPLFEQKKLCVVPV